MMGLLFGVLTTIFVVILFISYARIKKMEMINDNQFSALKDMRKQLSNKDYEIRDLKLSLNAAKRTIQNQLIPTASAPSKTPLVNIPVTNVVPINTAGNPVPQKYVSSKAPETRFVDPIIITSNTDLYNSSSRSYSSDDSCSSSSYSSSDSSSSSSSDSSSSSCD